MVRTNLFGTTILWHRKGPQFSKLCMGDEGKSYMSWRDQRTSNKTSGKSRVSQAKTWLIQYNWWLERLSEIHIESNLYTNTHTHLYIFYVYWTLTCSCLMSSTISRPSTKKANLFRSRTQEKLAHYSKWPLTPNPHIPHEQNSSASVCIRIPHHPSRTTP